MVEEFPLTLIQAKFLNFVYEDELKKIEQEYHPCKFSIFLPEKNGISQNELTINKLSDMIKPSDIIQRFRCFLYVPQLNKLVFETKQKAEEAMKHKTGSIMKQKFTLSHAKSLPRLVFKIQEKNMQICIRIFNHIFENFCEKTENIKIDKSLGKSYAFYLCKRYNQERVKCEKKFQVFWIVELLQNNSLNITFGYYKEDQYISLKKHLKRAIITEGIKTENWRPNSNVFEKLKNKETLARFENDFQISAFLHLNSQDIDLTGEIESIENFKKEFCDTSITIQLDGYLRIMMHETYKSKINEFCSQLNVTWQTKPQNPKLLKFIGGSKVLEKMKRRIEKLIENIKKQVGNIEITCERHEVPIIMKIKKEIQKDFSIIIKNQTTKKITLQYRHKLHSGKMIEVSLGDIVEQIGVDAIVNSSNERIEHSGGVAGSIQRYDGQSYIKACKNYLKENGKLKIGSAFTYRFQDPSDFKFIITTSGPLEQDEWKLRKTILSVLDQAESNKINSICMPFISTGIYSFDFETAVKIHKEEIEQFLENKAKHLMVVRFVHNKQSKCEKICEMFKKSFGETNVSLNLTVETLGVTRPDPESEYIWQWQEGIIFNTFFVFQYLTLLKMMESGFNMKIFIFL